MVEGKISCHEVLDDHPLIGIHVATADISNLPREIVFARSSIRRRCEAYVKEEEEHFEHLL
jgi:hypothetical protein